MGAREEDPALSGSSDLRSLPQVDDRDRRLHLARQVWSVDVRESYCGRIGDADQVRTLLGAFMTAAYHATRTVIDPRLGGACRFCAVALLNELDQLTEAG